MSTIYEAIVVGLGAMGSAATYHPARRGARVLALDMFPLGHDQGSSHGHHRMIRRSSWRPEIEQMIARTFTLWPELEGESGERIMDLIGEVALTDRGASGDYEMAFISSRRFAALAAGYQSIPAPDPPRSEAEIATIVAEERALTARPQTSAPRGE